MNPVMLDKLKWVRDEEGEEALAQSTGLSFTAYRAWVAPGDAIQVAQTDDSSQTRATRFIGLRGVRLPQFQADACWTAALDQWV